MKRIFTLVAAVCATAAFEVGHAQMVRLELHTIQSMTLSDQQFLTGRKDGEPVLLAGELRIPRASAARLPAVLLVHGSGGASAREATWAEHFNNLGVATFTLDSFTGRGLTSTGENQALLARLAMVVDAYRALELLAKHPRIDPARIAIMGFSRGGQATLYSSLKRFRKMHGSPEVEFAAYLPFYASCATTYIDDTDVSDKPIRLFHGSADDYVPVAPCRPYGERLRAAGKDVRLFEYAGAHHIFDNPMAGPPRQFPGPQSVRQCSLRESAPGRIINTKTDQPFTYDDACVQRGVTIGYDAAAHQQAVRDVTEFLKSTGLLSSPL